LVEAEVGVGVGVGSRFGGVILLEVPAAGVLRGWARRLGASPLVRTLRTWRMMEEDQTVTVSDHPSLFYSESWSAWGRGGD